MDKLDRFPKNHNALFVATEIPAVSELHGWLFIDHQVPAFEGFQGFVATSDLTKKRTSELRWKFEFLTDSRVVSAMESVGIEFFGLENILCNPTRGGKIQVSYRVEVLRFSDFNLDCPNGFQYLSILYGFLNTSTYIAQPGQQPGNENDQAALTGGVSTHRRI